MTGVLELKKTMKEAHVWLCSLVPGVFILAKAIVAGAIILAYLALSEFSAEPIDLARSLLRTRIIPAQHPNES